jgi:hypothetical protein
MKPIILALLLAPAVAAPAFAVDAKDLKAQAGEIADELLAQASESGKTVAVGGFTDSDGKKTALSELIAEDVELALVTRSRRGGYKMMDRRNVGELAKEWELSVDGSVDDDNLVHAGRLLGAEVLCVGKYVKVGRTITLRTTMVGSEKGEILGASSREIKLDGDLRDLSEKFLPPPPVRAAREIAPAASTGPLTVELSSDKAAYAVGDHMTVTARVNRDCYLTIIDVGAGGKGTILFPNIYAPSNAVKAGQTVTIPDPSAGFDFEVAPPRGLEVIRAIASKEPTVDLHDAMETPTAEAPFGGVKEELGMLTRDIHVKARKAKPGEWSESVLKLDIR